jgi:hypothetical protein
MLKIHYVDKVTLFVQSVSKTVEKLEINKYSTIMEAKLMIAREKSIPINKFKLIFHKTILDDKTKISEICYENETKIHILYNLLGGGRKRAKDLNSDFKKKVKIEYEEIWPDNQIDNKFDDYFGTALSEEIEITTGIDDNEEENIVCDEEQIDFDSEEIYDDEEEKDFKNYFDPFSNDNIIHVNNDDPEEIERKVSEHLKLNHFPSTNLEQLITYYSDPKEHPFLNYIPIKYESDYEPSFDVRHFNKFPSDKNKVGKLLKKTLFFGERNLTENFCKKYSKLEKDINGRGGGYTNVSKKTLPTPMKIFFCDSDRHPHEHKDFTDKTIFYFSPTCDSCPKCETKMDPTKYIVIFDLREQIHLKLLSLPKQILEKLTNNQKRQRSQKGTPFTEDNLINDVDSGLLYHILREKGWFDDIDISFTLMFNTDGVDLKRKSNQYNKNYGFWLAINELPIEMRFKKENMILLGLYSGEKIASTTLLEPFLNEFKKAFTPFRIEINGKYFSIRVLVLGTCLDGVEIPHVFNIMAHNSYYQCHNCNLVGKNDTNRRYFYRFSSGTQPFSSRVTRHFRDLLLTRLEDSGDTRCFQGNSKYVDQLPSFFPLSTSFGDSLHVVYEGIFSLYLQQLEKLYPKCYDLLVQITRNLKIPREESSYKCYIKGKMNAKDLKFLMINYFESCLTLSSFPKNVIQNVSLFRKIVVECEEKQEYLKVSRIFELIDLYLKWTKNFAKIFGNCEITSKIHRFEHMIVDIILVGKFWTHSCFPFESINIEITRGVKGTKNPIPSIIRQWRKTQYSSIWRNIFNNRKEIKVFIVQNFQKFSKVLFPKEIPPKDFQTSNLYKKYLNSSLQHFIWIENFESSLTSRGNLNNSILMVRIDGEISIGKVIQIQDLEKISLKVFKVDKMKRTKSIVLKVKKEKETILIKHHDILHFFAYTFIGQTMWLFKKEEI